MPEVQLTVNAKERTLLARLVASELRDVRGELRDADFATDFGQDAWEEEALLQRLLAKLEVASAALYAPAP
jgi:hypothetical protein